MSAEIIPFKRWAGIPGFPLYEVSTEGEVRSVPRIVTAGGKGGKKTVPGKPLRGSVTLAGYQWVWLFNGKVKECHYRHVLVLAAFVGPRPPGMQTRHLDGDRSNNRLENLAYGTAAENTADKHRHGTVARGSRITSAKLSEDDVKVIRECLRQRESQSAIARRYGVTQRAISAISRGVTWKHVGGVDGH